MATLNKLMITGIRNFCPEDGPQVIKFSTPVTLFLGQNGCGKTTIIESLKYACSGELPGGSNRGQGFLYDPHLSGSICTSGQIRLRIITDKGDVYTISKSMNVTVRKNTFQFKKVDNTLKLKKHGEHEEQMVSGRCIDVDNIFTEIMGISKSIVNNVIFCHQEDSLWPLDEGSKLKKKFDEIFEVTKYHKCGDLIRKIIKAKGEKVKLLEVELSYLEDKKKEVDRKQILLTEKELKADNYDVEIDNNEKKLGPIRTKLKEICALQKELTHLHEEKSAKMSENKLILQQIQKISSNLKDEEFKGTEEELKDAIKNFDKNRHEIDEKLKILSRKKAEIEVKETTHTNKKSKILAELGKLQQEKNNHLEKIKKRKEILLKIQSLLEINVLNEDEEEDINIDNKTKVIKDAIKSVHISLNELYDQISIKEAELQNKIDESRDNFNKNKHTIESKRSQVNEITKKCREIKGQLQELKFSDEQLKNIANKIDSISKEMQIAKENFDKENITQATIDKEKNIIKRLEEKQEELEEEMKVLVKNSITEAEIERRQFDVKKRENDLIRLKNKHHDNFQVLFGSSPPQSNLKDAVETIKTENTRKVNEITRNINQQQNTLTRKQAQLKFSNERLQALENELKSGENKITEYCKAQSYERAKEFATLATEKLRKDKGQYSSAKVMYEKFIEEFENEKCCPLCKSQFSNKEQVVNEIVNDLKQKIKEIPSKLKKIEEELKSSENKLTKITELASINENIKDISEKQIPSVIFEIDVLTSDCDQIQKDLQILNKNLEKPQQLESVCNEVLSDATLIDQNSLEISNSQDAIENLNLQIIKLGSNRTRQGAEAEIENIKIELGNSRRAYENKMKRQQLYINRCQELREKKSKLIQEQLDIQKQMKGKPQLEEQLADYTAKIIELEENIKDLENILPSLENELREAEKNIGSEKMTNKKILNEAQQQLNRNEKLFEEMEKFTAEINEYVEKRREAVFEKNLEYSIKLEEIIQELSNAKSETIEEINEVKNKQGKLELQFRNLTDSLDLKERRKRSQLLNEEISTLSKKIGDYDEETILNEKMKLERSGADIYQSINTCKGMKNELEAAIQELKAELQKPDFKLAVVNHRRKFYEVKITERAIRDLKEYLLGFEYSIMYFHKERMIEINKIIRDYWRLIYRGNDIDYIEIKTEQDPTSSAKRRVYNYRVVQVKNDIEMEMRGRCSAGQKVLASLIIRLALAETFSRKCGILALDEPTTNLDRSNILSLSEALANIVDSKINEKSFQLLIITHDEEFLNALATIDKAEFINRVKRNEEGHSLVQTERL